MRMSAYVVTALLAASLPHAAMAQSADLAPAAVPPAVEPARIGATLSHWLVSGFVGSNFGRSTTSTNVDFGGHVGWLWRGIIGAEAIADFAPSVSLTNPALFENPSANSFMGNAVFALPIGAEGQFQPYFSGGVGEVQLKARVLNAFLPRVSGSPVTGTTDGNRMKTGTNFGGGIMGFMGTLGFRADVRYYKAGTNQTQVTDAAGQFTDSLLTSLDFWRANIGVVLRF